METLNFTGRFEAYDLKFGRYRQLNMLSKYGVVSIKGQGHFLT